VGVIIRKYLLKKACCGGISEAEMPKDEVYFETLATPGERKQGFLTVTRI